MKDEILKIDPSDKNQEKEDLNLDFYYTPEGYKCFTENFHLKRGYCCRSGCRHCPYGYDKRKDNF